MFRYPGGKLRLGKKIDKEISKRWPEAKESHWLVLDGFVGGGGSLLNMASDFPHWNFVINDQNSSVSAFWRFFLDASDSDWTEFYHKVEKEEVTLGRYNAVFDSKPDNSLDAAFKMLFLNKTSFNGFVTQRLPIGGREQKGKWKVGVYWNPPRLISNCEKARRLLGGRVVGRGSLNTVDLLDEIDVDFVYLDPPYLVHGETWYGIPFGIEDLSYIRTRLNRFSRWAVSINHEDRTLDVFKNDRIIPMKVIYTAASAHNPKGDGGIKETSELLILGEN